MSEKPLVNVNVVWKYRMNHTFHSFVDLLFKMEESNIITVQDVEDAAATLKLKKWEREHLENTTS